MLHALPALPAPSPNTTVKFSMRMYGFNVIFGEGWGGVGSCSNLPSSIILALMSKGRVEAFSDGVIAILITIMVLELHVPEGADWFALKGLAPIFLSYILSFVFLGIYWNNHHHLFQAAKQVNGSVLWANLHLLFWLSLISFVTGWMGENNFAQLPVALYGVVLWMSGLAYYLLTRALVALHGTGSIIATALGTRVKEIGSLGAYTMAILFAFINTNVSLAIYAFVALIWLIPDTRIESALGR